MSETTDRCAETFEAEIAKHGGLLCRWARYYAHGRNGVEVEELIHEGRLAMWQMWGKYESSMGVKFLTFATLHIRRRMLWHVMQATETIRIPRQENLKKWIVKRVPMKSLDAPMVQGWGEAAENGTLADILMAETLSPAECVQRADDYARMAHLISRLPARHQRIMAARYQEGLTIRAVAAEMGITHQRVYQIEADAIVMLRRGMLQMKVKTPREARERRVAA